MQLTGSHSHCCCSICKTCVHYQRFPRLLFTPLSHQQCQLLNLSTDLHVARIHLCFLTIEQCQRAGRKMRACFEISCVFLEIQLAVSTVFRQLRTRGEERYRRANKAQGRVSLRWSAVRSRVMKTQVFQISKVKINNTAAVFLLFHNNVSEKPI